MKVLSWRVDLIGELKGSMVNGETGLRSQNVVRLDRFMGCHVDRDMNQRGSYAPIGNSAISGAPKFARICAK
jgi:hypothetical protein